MGEKQTQAGSVHQERTGQKTRRSRAFRPHTLPRKPTIFLTAPLSHAAMAIHLGPCEQLRRDRKLATSSDRTDCHQEWNPLFRGEADSGFSTLLGGTHVTAELMEHGSHAQGK